MTIESKIDIRPVKGLFYGSIPIDIIVSNFVFLQTNN